ncbi:hypothetical protein [Sulfurimonas sp.]|uniref:hypothetical protein n=1 Tax=Sulfurimonas sp. TaxID=2022749 RepID=UPI0025CE3CF3|nr:hypothetical protein [Sulfurimonas sp.]
MGLFGKSKNEKELEKKINDLKIENKSLKDNFDRQRELLKTKEKNIDLLMKINSKGEDDHNIVYLVKFGFGDKNSITNWFEDDNMKDILLGRFNAMLKAHYQMYQDYGSHILTDEISRMLDNDLISNRIDELAEINDAHYLQASFKDWQGQFSTVLEDSKIEYNDYDEQTITSYLVYETMFRALMMRMK